jgi:N12 class adenine-specific DNA methylase
MNLRDERRRLPVTKYQLITSTYESALAKVTSSPDEWTAFLSSACRNYKCRFDEQILIYTQRPDAMAVLEIEKWNRGYGRWVNRGAKGIAVFDGGHNGQSRLKHYFDISDTSAGKNARPVPVWQMEPGYEAEVIEHLVNAFGELEDDSTLATALISAAKNAVDDNLTDYLSELMSCREDSFSENLNEQDVELAYRSALEHSVAYMLLTRCGIDPIRHIDATGFRHIADFNTRQTVNALGIATSDIAENCVREIAAVVQDLQKTEREPDRTFEMPPQAGDNITEKASIERSHKHGSTDIPERGRLHAAQSDHAGGSARSPWQVRVTQKEVPEAAPPDPVHEPFDKLHIERTPDGDRASGERANGTADHTDGGGTGSGRGTESRRSDEMGGADEQYQTERGGNDTPRSDIRIKPLPSEAQQLTLFEAEETAKAASAFLVSQQIIDEVLTSGSGVQHGKFRIYSYFLGSHTAKEKTDFLKNEYGTGGSGRAGFTEWHDSKGISFNREINHMPYDKVSLPWSKVARRIDELIADGRYMTESELAYIPEYEKGILAGEVYFFYSHQPEDVPHPFPYDADYSDAVEVIRPQLDEPERVSEILSQMAGVLDNTANFDRNYLSMQKAFADLTAYQNGEYSLFVPIKPAEKEIETAQIAPSPTLPEPPVTSAGEVAEYDLHLGTAVWLGLDEYEIVSFGDTLVELRDISAPLITRELPRAEFDNKLSENTLNDHLIITSDSGASEKAPAEQEDKPRIPNVGERYEIQGRKFVVDSVDEAAGKVSLRDVTFEGNAGFPIFRSGSLDFIRKYDPVRLERQPGFETRGESAVADNAPAHPRELSDDEDASLSKEQLPTEEEILTPSWQQRERRNDTAAVHSRSEIPMSERHNYRITNDNLGAGGPKTKFRYNVEAIKTLQIIEQENRFATPEEQETLARYVGFGSISQAFDPEHKDWTGEYAELKALLSEKEWKSARDSAVNAHYTSPVVINAIYKAVENMGFRTGNVLEPSCGIGNFFGLAPESMADSKFYGVELDSLTGRIARQLYQKNSIAIQGFEDADLPDSFFDLAIGNVPFGEYQIADKRYDKHNFLIHDYFFAKALDKVRPGGIVAFVTSKGTLDKRNPAVRRYIAQRADLLGAVRLPNTAFKSNAGTEVTADIIFLQKRDRIIDIEPDWVHLGQLTVDSGQLTVENGEPSTGVGQPIVPVNSYFAEHPDMILGEMVFDDSMYGNRKDTACHPIPGSDLTEQLSEAITNIHAEVTEYERNEDEQDEDGSIPADPDVRNFSYAITDGRIYYRQDSRMVSVTMPVTAQGRVRGLIELRECARNLITYQTENYPDSDIAAEQSELNRLYDSFTKKYGLINSRGNSLAFAQDSAYPLLCSLEILDENGKLARKADMFTRRTIRPHIPVTHVDTATEALAVSMSEKARVDLAYMSELSGMTEEALIEELRGVIFLNIGNAKSQDKTYVTADEYLSGNVREKLVRAKAAAYTDPSLDVNVNALEAALPEDLTAAEISVRLGATWLPEDIVQQFMYELFETAPHARGHIKIHYSQSTGAWNVTEKSYDRSNIHSFNTYGTQRVSAYKIIEESLNLRDVRVWDKVYTPEGDEKRVINKKETAIAQAKQEIIRSKFEEWVWQDPARRERLCRLYNDTFNSIRLREYDGSHLTFPGMNPEIVLRKHQVDAIARILYGGNTLLAHEVGAGKTFEMACAAMESKRLGLCNKSLIVVPNHITEQWAAEWLQLYPSANILIATMKDFEKRNRKKFCARIATGDYDAVIIGHSQFEKIPISRERQAEMLEMQIEETVNGIEEVKRNNGEKFTVKQMVKAKKSLEVKLKKLNDQNRKDEVVTFEELGIDRLYVDEAHHYKNLFLRTKMRNVGGIAQTEAQKSSDLYMKCRYLDELTGGRGTVFATGTPISNSMVELFTMQRYLQYGELKKHGLEHFDAWASTFGETVTAIELAPEGTGYRAKTRFAKFFNLPELMSMFKMTADIQTADMLDLPIPKANYHNVVIKPSEWQRDMVAELADRAEKIRAGKVEPAVDNMLKITNDGRKLALDQRLINELLPDDPNGKVSVCADNVFRIWNETKEKRLAQLVFCDLSTPKPTDKETGEHAFNVYDDVKQKLVARGVPESEIAYIHDAKTEAKKAKLFAKVRKGHIRVLLGSTQKMGAGTNVQDRLIALHDLDCPWRPSDLAQRLGRIVRQGNLNPEVEIFRYVTEGTFDSYLYQLVENKQRFISQVMTSKTPVRIAEDVDETALSYAEIKALATGNPFIIEKCQLEMEVNKLKILQASHNGQKYALEDKILKEYPREIKRLTERIAGYTADIETAAKHPADKDHFPPMKIGGNTFTKKADAGKAIIDACKAMTSPDPVPLGEYRGFSLILSFDNFFKEYKVTLSGALSHTVGLGTDIHGNITRLDNALAGFASSLQNCREQLAETETQLRAAQSEVTRPFAQELELASKAKRLAEVNSMLNMDEKDSVVLDFIPDEEEMEAPQKVAGRER